MSLQPLRLRRAARADARDITARYRREAGSAVAAGFVVALDQAPQSIAVHPTTGSLRYAELSGLPGLRFRPLHRYPHLIFYVVRQDHVDVLRVLHGKRDLPVEITGAAR